MRQTSIRSLFSILIIAIAVFFLCPRAASSADLHERAKNLYDIGDYRASLNLYERILDSDPGDGLAWDLSAWCLRYLGDRESAERNYKKALMLLRGEDIAWPLIGLGELYIDSNAYEDALIRLREALSVARDNEEAYERAQRGIDTANREIEKNVAANVKPEPAMLDTDERQRELLNYEITPEKMPDEDAAVSVPKPAASEQKNEVSKPKPEETKDDAKKPAPTETVPPKPPEIKTIQHEIIHGIKLGDPTPNAAILAGLGISISGPPFAKSGKDYLAIDGVKINVPAALTLGVSSKRCYMVSHNGLVLSVNIELDYDKSRSLGDLKDATLAEISAVTGGRTARGLCVTENIFTNEINFAVTGTYGLWIVATDKGNGSCRLEIQHIDLHGLSNFWSSKK